MIKEGFYKVSEHGFSLTVAVFFNPQTKEEYSCKVWDMEDDRVAFDMEEERFTPIDKQAQKAWLRYHGIISIGDVVEVFKGRKVPIGTISKIVKVYNWKDRYNRIQATYAVLENGMKTNIENCRLV